MKILFMCLANSARSQIAEGLAKTLWNDQVTVMSAGIQPASTVHQGAITVMQEIGIDISANKPKLHDDLPISFLVDLDYVITVCEDEICPPLTVKCNRLRWSFPDPVLVKGEEQIKVFRDIRDTMREKILDFAKEQQILA